MYGGIYYTGSLNYKTYSSVNGMPGDKITRTKVAPDGAIWVCSEHSSNITIIKQDSITYRSVPDGFGSSSINDISFRTNGEAWITSSYGLYLVKNDKALHVLAKRGYGGQYNVIPNPDGTVWVNDYSQIELFKKVRDSMVIDKLTLVNSKIYTLCRDSTDQSIWVGTLKGLYHMVNDSLISYGEKYPLLKNRINEIKQTVNKDLWIVTRDTGIIVKKGNKLMQITTKDGLVSNFCQCICVDHKGDIWVGTNKGISHILLKNSSSSALFDTIINISAPNLIEVNSITCDYDTIYASTSNGLTVFNMNKVTDNKIRPPVYITGIKINNKNRNLSSIGNLSYDENYLIISFVGLTYKDAGNTQYRYKMEGIDTGWVYTKNRDVQYPKMQPGNYKFLVSAMNNDGKWNEKPATISINIAPPFWATWWARITFILAVAGFIYWRFKVVETRTKRSAEVNRQIVTMELRELKAQMDPHFLFNNLNTLTHLVELKSDDAPEFVEELAKYYRYSLQFRNAEFTPLENELKQADRYLHILKIRFGDNLKVTWNIKESLRTHYLATYSLQLLLENITKHNIVSADKPLWVTISTTDHGTMVVKNQVQLKNSSALSNRHGLKSINQRYQLLTSKNIEVSQTSEYFSVELPLITPAEYENTHS